MMSYKLIFYLLCTFSAQELLPASAVPEPYTEGPVAIDVTTLSEEQSIKAQCEQAEKLIESYEQHPDTTFDWLKNKAEEELKVMVERELYILWQTVDYLMPDKDAEGETPEGRATKIATARAYLDSLKKEQKSAKPDTEKKSPAKDTALIAACTKGDVAEVKKLCEATEPADIVEVFVCHARECNVVECLLTTKSELLKPHVPKCLENAAYLGHYKLVRHLLKHHGQHFTDASINSLGKRIIVEHNAHYDETNPERTAPICQPLQKVVQRLKKENDARRIKRQAISGSMSELKTVDAQVQQKIKSFGPQDFVKILEFKHAELDAPALIAAQIERAHMLLRLYEKIQSCDGFDIKQLAQLMENAIRLGHFILADILFFLSINKIEDAQKHLAAIYARYKYLASFNEKKDSESKTCVLLSAKKDDCEPPALKVNPGLWTEINHNLARAIKALAQSLLKRDQTMLHLTCDSLFIRLLTAYARASWLYDIMQFFVSVRPDVLWTVDEVGDSALHLAAFAQNIDLGKLFLRHSQLIQFNMKKLRNNARRTPDQCTFHAGFIDILKDE